jgi:hypothetical protein
MVIDGGDGGGTLLMPNNVAVSFFERNERQKGKNKTNQL